MPAVVAPHGRGGNAETPLPPALPLYKAGFTLPPVDARCHGRSDEDNFASMSRFAQDLGQAVGWRECRGDIGLRSIAIIGHSVGAGAPLPVAARRNGIAAVAGIAAFTNPAATMHRCFAGKGIPYRPLGRLMRCPVLLAHAAEDTTVPVGEVHALRTARSDDHVPLKVVAGSHHDYAGHNREMTVLFDFLSDIDGCRRET